MSTPKNFRLYSFLFLAFCVFSSKNILIYNEETLITLCFFGFLFFVLHFYGHTIKDSLNERSGVIGQELQNFALLKLESSQELSHQHQNVRSLSKIISPLHVATRERLGFTINGEKTLANQSFLAIDSGVKTVMFSEFMREQHLQWCLSENLISRVLVALSKAGDALLEPFQNGAINVALEKFAAQAKKQQGFGVD